jgi:hypothetical protein
MRLYSRTGVTALDDPEFGTFAVDAAGGFDFPDEVSDKLHGFHHRGQPMWETDIERQQRLMSEELERRKDPATLLSAVEQLVKAAAATSALTAAASGATDAVKQLAAASAEPEPEPVVTEPEAEPVVTEPAPADETPAPAKKATRRTAAAK